jgi:16S rRNA (cytosine1402-N4)-methyltransferase
MRMDQGQLETAARLVAEATEERLAAIFWELGDERQARRIARAIVNERVKRPLVRTRQLADLVERVIPRRGRIHPATRVFQALRIAINDELALLRHGLPAVWRLLRPGGRLAVITFHSIEDRIVKEFGREMTRDYRVAGAVDLPEFRTPAAPRARWLRKKAWPPDPAEMEANPRARSAQLRVLERI